MFYSYYDSNSSLKGSSGCIYENDKIGLLKYPIPGAFGRPVTDEELALQLLVLYAMKFIMVVCKSSMLLWVFIHCILVLFGAGLIRIV